MADRYLLESGGTDGYLLEDGSGVLLLELTTYTIVNNNNTTVTDLGSGIYRIKKTGGVDGTYDAGAVSTAGLTGDFVLRLNKVTTGGTVKYGGGMGANPTADDSHVVDYVWLYEPSSAFWYIFEGGSFVDAKAENDFAWMWRTGTTLGYGRGATIAAAQASPDRTVTATGTLYFDSSFAISNAELDALLYEVAGAQTLEPALFTNTQTFHSPSVSPGAVTLTPSLFSDGDTFFTPTVTPGSVTISPTLFADGDTFYSPTVTSLWTLTPSLYSDGDTFYSPTITSSNTLTPALYSDGDTFYSPSLLATYALTAVLFADGDTFFGPTLTSLYTLSPDLFVDGDTFFSPTVSLPGGSLSPDLFINSQSFPTPIISSNYVLAPDLYADADTFFGPTVTATIQLLPGVFTNAQTFYAMQVLSSGGAGGSAGPKVVAFFYRI